MDEDKLSNKAVIGSNARGYDARGYDPNAHLRYVKSLLEGLAILERDTDPRRGDSSASGKDSKAFEALQTAGDLVRAVAGWAIDHQCGLAAENLGYVAPQPSGTRDHSEYLTQLRRADGHRHERAGSSMQDADVFSGISARQQLINCLLPNPCGLPDELHRQTIEGLRALDMNEVLPIFQPNKDRSHVRYRELRHQLKTIGFVEYRVALGEKREAAQRQVAEAYSVSWETLKTWTKRVKERLGSLECARTVALAKNAASHTIAAQADPAASTSHAAVASVGRYGDEALAAAAKQYRLEKRE